MVGAEFAAPLPVRKRGRDGRVVGVHTLALLIGVLGAVLLANVLAASAAEHPGVNRRGALHRLWMASKRAILLHYIESLSAKPGHSILSGQWFAGPSWPKAYDHFVKELADRTGKDVAILASDYDVRPHSSQPLTDPPRAEPERDLALDQILIDHWKSGGIVSLTWFVDNPWYRLGMGESCHNVPKPCTPGSLMDLTHTDNQAGAYFKAEMDVMIGHLRKLQDAGVVVLFRPFHEMNGNWFWWGAQSATKPTAGEFVALWRYVHDYFVGDGGLDNVIWVYSPQNSDVDPRIFPWGVIMPTKYFYPGTSYVDVIGLDYYKDRLGPSPEQPGPGADDFSLPTYGQLMALGKPLGLAELGPGDPTKGVFDFDAIAHEILRDYPKLAFFIAWEDDPANHKYFSIVGNQSATELMHDPVVLTRDRVRLWAP